MAVFYIFQLWSWQSHNFVKTAHTLRYWTKIHCWNIATYWQVLLYFLWFILLGSLLYSKPGVGERELKRPSVPRIIE